jgi:hypothetical protein
MLHVDGFAIDPPPDFRTEEMTIGLRQAALPGMTSSPSLIIQSKRARQGATLEQIATETLVELGQTLRGMKNVTRSELIFADGGSGAVLSYDWTTATGDMRQYFVLRLNGDRVCSVTLTARRDSVTAESAAPIMQTIASLRLAPRSAP